MTLDEIQRWSNSKEWDLGFLIEPELLRYEMDRELGLMVCVTRPAYAECQGPDDPHCGRCRFSSHECAGAPTRNEYFWLIHNAL